MNRYVMIMVSILILVMLTGCLAEPNVYEQKPDEVEEIAGFWQGIWHGVTTPFAFIISLFSDKVGIYEIENNGNWYNFGFVIGLSIMFGGSSKSTCKKKKS